MTDEIEGALNSEVPAVAELCKQVERFRGKMLRPTLVLVSGAACGIIDRRAPDNAELLKLAAVVEMVHMATLVHDDVLDEAEIRQALRRPSTTGPAMKSAVLVGRLLDRRLIQALREPQTIPNPLG